MVSLATHPSNGQYGSSWMRAVVWFRHDAEHSVLEPRDELKWYIESPLEDVENVVTWWGVSDHIYSNTRVQTPLTQSKL